MILAGVGFLLWAAARFVEAKAKANPKHDKWDDLSPKLVWANKMLTQAIQLYVESKAFSWSGKERLAEVQKRVLNFEKQWESGNYAIAISEIVGIWEHAKGKAKAAGKLIPFGDTTHLISQPPQADMNVGPHDKATE